MNLRISQFKKKILLENYIQVLVFTGYVYIIVKYSNECVLSDSGDKTIKLWNVNSDECLRKFTGHLKSVSSVEILSNERIMSGSWDKRIKIWIFQIGDCLQTLDGHTD